MKLSIIIPVYNEVKTIEQVVSLVSAARTPGCDKEIIIVDDGSTDGTREILARIPSSVRVILQPANAGKGAAVKAGINAATGDSVLIQDADLEYNPNDYAALLQPILDGKATVTLGSRVTGATTGSATQWRHPHPLTYVGNVVIRTLINILYHRHGTDFFACYKIIPRSYFSALSIEADGFAYDIELLCKLFRKRIPVVEVPIEYHPRTFAQGKKIRYWDGVKVIWAIVAWRFRKIP